MLGGKVLIAESGARGTRPSDLVVLRKNEKSKAGVRESKCQHSLRSYRCGVEQSVSAGALSLLRGSHRGLSRSQLRVRAVCFTKGKPDFVRYRQLESEHKYKSVEGISVFVQDFQGNVLYGRLSEQTARVCGNELREPLGGNSGGVEQAYLTARARASLMIWNSPFLRCFKNERTSAAILARDLTLP